MICYFELVLIYVVLAVRWSKDLTLIDAIHFQSLQDLSFSEMSDSCLSHDRDRNCSNNISYHFRVARSCDSSVSFDVSWNSFKCHHTNCSGCFCDSSLNKYFKLNIYYFSYLNWVDYIHDYSSFQESDHTSFYGPGVFDWLSVFNVVIGFQVKWLLDFGEVSSYHV